MKKMYYFQSKTTLGYIRNKENPPQTTLIQSNNWQLKLGNLILKYISSDLKQN